MGRLEWVGLVIKTNFVNSSFGITMKREQRLMKLFELRRSEDESGISGTGTVAQGVIFDNGWCALTWLTEHTSVAFYTSIKEVIAIHGHGGKIEVVQLAGGV